MSAASSVVIGDPAGEHIRISVSRRQREPAGEYHDDNWLDARIGMRVAGFCADYAAELMTGDLATLRDVLARLAGHRPAGHRPGREEWQPFEPWLLVRFEMGVDDGRATGIACERLDDGNSLHFSMRIAWWTFEAAIDELDLLLIEFPVLGSTGSR